MSIVKPRLLQRVDSYLKTHPESKVLDVGFGTGDQAFDMARNGHDVTAITIDESELALAQEAKLRHGLGDAALNFELLDATDIAARFEPGSFDVVLAHNVFHLMDKGSASFAIDSMKRSTRKRGINAVGGYVIGSDTPVTSETRQMFRSGELNRHYGPGWDVQRGQEDDQTVTMEFNGKTYVTSHTDLIAIKR